MNKLIAILFAITTSACVIEAEGEGDWESGGQTESSESYSNRVKLECNGSVLIDRTFTSKSECESFRESNSFTCSGIEMSFSC